MIILHVTSTLSYGEIPSGFVILRSCQQESKFENHLEAAFSFILCVEVPRCEPRGATCLEKLGCITLPTTHDDAIQ
jgi:hypothetical protein